MGLFSKKTFICERCGKEYQRRLAFGDNICDECFDKEYEEEEEKKRIRKEKEEEENRIRKEKENEVRGYVRYAQKMYWNPYNIKQLEEIVAHRNRLLNKFRNPNGLSHDELNALSGSIRQMDDAKKTEMYSRMNRSALKGYIGASINKMGVAQIAPAFFVPTGFEGTIVDAGFVFAVGYTGDYKHQTLTTEYILCAVFTNDPYIPAFPVVMSGDVGLLEFTTKSKEGRKHVESFFSRLCPNLRYPVQELKKLKSQISREKSVKGNIKLKEMLRLIDNANVLTDVFDTKHISNELPLASEDMMDQIGYVDEMEMCGPYMRLNPQEMQEYNKSFVSLLPIP